MTISGGTSGPSRSRTGKLVDNFEEITKEQALQVEGSKTKTKVKEESNVQPKQVSTGQTSTFAPVSEDKGKQKQSETSLLDQVGQRPLEKSSGGDISIMKRQLKKRGGSTKETVSGDGTQLGKTIGTAPLPKSSEVLTRTVFHELKTEFPRLQGHFDKLGQAGVKVELVDKDPAAVTGAYYNQGTNTIRLRDNPPMTRMEVKDNVLFESFNAAAQEPYKALDERVRKGQLSIPGFGREKATVESQVTVDHVDSVLANFHGPGRTEDRQKLIALAKQVPESLAGAGRQKQDELNEQAKALGVTEKGLRALAWSERLVPGYLNAPDSKHHPVLRQDIMSKPHDANADPDKTSSMLSPDMYFYEKLGSMSPLALRSALKTCIPAQERGSGWAREISKALETGVNNIAPPPVTDTSVEAVQQRARAYHEGIKLAYAKLGELQTSGSISQELFVHVKGFLDGYQLTPGIKQFMQTNDPNFQP